MGWDAFSSATEQWDAKCNIKNKKLRAAFKKAVENVAKQAPSVDGMLRNGGLDVSTCRRMLEKATGEN